MGVDSLKAAVRPSARAWDNFRSDLQIGVQSWPGSVFPEGHVTTIEEFGTTRMLSPGRRDYYSRYGKGNVRAPNA